MTHKQQWQHQIRQPIPDMHQIENEADRPPSAQTVLLRWLLVAPSVAVVLALTWWIFS